MLATRALLRWIWLTFVCLCSLCSQGIEVLEIEKQSLTRKNEFLASSLHTIRRRDQARAAVQRLLGKTKP